MEAKHPKSSPSLSQLFFDSVINVKSEPRNQQQVNSESASDIDRPPSQPNFQLPQAENRFPSPQPGHPASVDVSSNLLRISEQSLSILCESSESSSISSTLQPHQYYPVPPEYFGILMEDATDRYAEASKFFHKAHSYSFMFEFHIKILNDLLEELANIPSNMEAEAYQSASTLCQRLRLLQLHLVGRRNLLLGDTRDQWRNEEISPPAGTEIYLEAAAEAKAARQRQCQLVVLVQTITDLKMKENMCKQRRLEAEAELIRYFDQLKLSSDGNGRLKYERPETANETAPPVEKETCQNGDDLESYFSDQVSKDNEFESSSTSHTQSDLSNDPCVLVGKDSCKIDDVKFSNSHVHRDDKEFGSSFTGPSCLRNDSSTGPGVSVGKKTCHNGDNMESFHTEQDRLDDNVFESSSPRHNQNDSSNDRYCVLWMESSEMEKSYAADQKTPLFIRLKPSTTCLFCNGLHWSHLCLKMSTLERRFRYLCDHGTCYICGTAHKGACADSERVCKWPQCRAINSHHSALCPNVKYPITGEVVQAYERRINDLNRIHKRPQV